MTSKRTTARIDSHERRYRQLAHQLADIGYIAAGSVITDLVPSDALALGRSRQTNKPGWVTNKRRKS